MGAALLHGEGEGEDLFISKWRPRRFQNPHLTEGERRFLLEPSFIFISLKSGPSILRALGLNKRKSQSQRGGVGRGLGVGAGLGVGIILGVNSRLRIMPP
jgi:hypothetical protein